MILLSLYVCCLIGLKELIPYVFDYHNFVFKKSSNSLDAESDVKENELPEENDNR